MTVSILGREYELIEKTPEEDPLLHDSDGYCDNSIATCIINKFEKREIDSLKDLDSHKRKVMRHEIIHAFLFESGLFQECEWSCEEMIDWVASQFPKMVKAFREAGCMEQL